MREWLDDAKAERTDDNARKFIISRIDERFLRENGARSYNLRIDWIDIDGKTERKIVRSRHEGGLTEYSLIEKVDDRGNRTTGKKVIEVAEYEALLHSSIAHLEKRRYEFGTNQGHSTFRLKYDVFSGGRTCMLEVDADNASERDSFSSAKLPFRSTEVTGDTRYYGFRMVEVLGQPANHEALILGRQVRKSKRGKPGISL